MEYAKSHLTSKDSIIEFLKYTTEKIHLESLVVNDLSGENKKKRIHYSLPYRKLRISSSVIIRKSTISALIVSQLNVFIPRSLLRQVR